MYCSLGAGSVPLDAPLDNVQRTEKSSAPNVMTTAVTSLLLQS